MQCGEEVQSGCGPAGGTRTHLVVSADAQGVFCKTLCHDGAGGGTWCWRRGGCALTLAVPVRQQGRGRHHNARRKPCSTSAPHRRGGCTRISRTRPCWSWCWTWTWPHCKRKVSPCTQMSVGVCQAAGKGSGSAQVRTPRARGDLARVHTEHECSSTATRVAGVRWLGNVPEWPARQAPCGTMVMANSKGG